MKFYARQDYEMFLDTWMADITQWIVWSNEETNTNLKLLYKRTAIRSIKQLHMELKEIKVPLEIVNNVPPQVNTWHMERSMEEWVSQIKD